MYNKAKLKPSSCVLIFIVIYALFAFRRIKAIGLPYLNGTVLNNLIIVIPLLALFLVFICANKFCFEKRLSRLFLLFVFISLISLFNYKSIAQSLYAFFLFLVPILLFFCVGKNEYHSFGRIVTLFVLLSLAYSVLAIIASFNYGTLLSKIGITNIDDQYNSQYRASLMIGSGITVSYFLNATLPLAFLKLYTTGKKRTKLFYIVVIILNAAATIIENSRLAVASMLLIILFCSFFFKKQDFKNLWKKFFVVIASGIVLLVLINRIDVSRLFMGFKDASTSERMDAFKLAIHIFRKNPLFGKGLGTYFYRAWSDQRYITVDGITGLIDPHNTQALLLAETGLIGTALFYLFLFFVFVKFIKIQNILVKKTAIIFFVAYLLGSLGGTQLITEISYSSIIWIMMGLFYGYYHWEKNESVGRYLSRYKYRS